MQRHVTVTTGSRLHFGLFSFGHQTGRQFGGAGIMIDQPRLKLQITPADRLIVRGPQAHRAEVFARRWFESSGCSLVPESYAEAARTQACQITLLQTSRSHTGLGSGTQMALSIAAGLNAYFQLPPQTPVQLATSVGRGLRSAVGTYGFTSGGMIVDGGKSADDVLAPLECRLEVPEYWRFVLICPHLKAGLSGDEETRVFSRLPAVPATVTERMVSEVNQQMIPAVRQHDFDRFSTSLFRYSQLAGQCYQQVQGGLYNGSVLTDLVERITRKGIQGVAQSSWGPTIFAAVPNQEQAEHLASHASQLVDRIEVDVWIARPCSHGVEVSTDKGVLV